MNVSINIKKYRKEKKMTQKALAEKANISRSYLGDLESGRYNPSLDTLRTIASALDIDINLLRNTLKKIMWNVNNKSEDL